MRPEQYPEKKALEEANEMRDFVDQILEKNEKTTPEHYAYAAEMVKYTNIQYDLVEKAIKDLNVIKIIQSAKSEEEAKSSLRAYLQDHFSQELSSLSLIEEDSDFILDNTAESIIEAVQAKIKIDFKLKSLTSYNVNQERVFDKEFTFEELIDVINELDKFDKSDLAVLFIKKDKNGKTFKLCISVKKDISLKRFKGKNAFYILDYPTISKGAEEPSIESPIIFRMLVKLKDPHTLASDLPILIETMATYDGSIWVPYKNS